MLAFLHLALAPALLAHGASIASFDARVSLSADGIALAREDIRVEAGPDSFPRGFFRELEDRRLTPAGLRVLLPIRVREVLLDGRPVPWRERRGSRGVTVSVPGPLPAGHHAVRLTYRAAGRVALRPDGDVLRWTATRNEWGLPIRAATLAFALPGGRTDAVLRRRSWIGEASRPAQAAEAIVDEGSVVFWAGRPLGPEEGLGASIALEKGLLRPPPQGGPGRRLLRDNLHLAVGAAGWLLVFLYYLPAALRRREEEPDPEGSAPPGLSPASAAYVLGAGQDAAVLGTLVRARLSPRESLEPEERAFLDRLDAAGSAAAARELEERLAGRWERHLRSLPWPKAFSGAALAAGIAAAMRLASTGELSPASVAAALGAGAAAAAGGAVLAAAWAWTWRAWRSAQRSPRLPVSLGAVALGFLSFGLTTAACDGFLRLMRDVSPLLLLEAAALWGTSLVGWRFLRGPDEEGLEALRDARGVLAFLAAHRRGVPEELLPYAAALGTEHDWPPGPAKALAEAKASCVFK